MVAEPDFHTTQPEKGFPWADHVEAKNKFVQEIATLPGRAVSLYVNNVYDKWILR